VSEPPAPASPAEKGYWHCTWPESASYADPDPGEPPDPKGAEFGLWLASPGVPEPVRAAPAGALLAAFYAGWEAACEDHAAYAGDVEPEWVPGDGDGEG
jgi:hypothetical protein